MAGSLTEFLIKYNGDAKSYHATDAKVNQSLTKTDNKAKKVGGSFGKSMGKLGKGVAVVGAAAIAGAAAAFKFTDAMSKQLDSIDKGSQKMDVSAESYQEWSHVLNLAGSSIASMEKGVKTLSSAAYEASIGTKTYTDTFDALGVAVTNTDGTLKSSEQLMSESIKALSGMEDITKRNA